jgi:NTP pyrophosphatase (non-canonical NTP hydrolase)
MSKIPELLDLLQEECAEVIQNVSKVRRFGLENAYLNGEGTQREALVKEIADVLLLVSLLEAHGLFKGQDINNLMAAKSIKLAKWTKVYED